MNNVEKILSNINVTPDSRKHEDGLKAILQAQEQSNKTKTAAKQPVNIGITIMKHKLTKLAAAAVILIALLITFNRSGVSPDGATIAWADVVEQIKKAKSVHYHCKTVVNDFTWSNEVMINAGGVERHAFSNTGDVQIFDFKNGIQLQLNTNSKTAYRSKRAPQPFIKLFNSLDFLASRHEKGNISFIGYEIIDEIEVEIYQDTQPLQYSNTKIWINVETKLPIKVVSERIPPTNKKYFPIKNISINSKDFGYNESKSVSGRLSGSCTPEYTKQVMTDFEWNIDLEPELFSTSIPDGYELHEQTFSTSEPNETELIDMLQLWAEMSDGILPVDITKLMDPNIIKQMIMKKFYKGKDPKQEYYDATNFLETARWAAAFVEEKIVLQENWNVSTGQVMLGDAEKPLYWWKLDNSKLYRVIFGDLTIKDIALEDLPK